MSNQADPAWGFWQKSKAALDELNDVMQVFATHVAQDNAIELPPHTVRRARRAASRFDESFSLLVREQKRKAARR